MGYSLLSFLSSQARMPFLVSFCIQLLLLLLLYLYCIKCIYQSQFWICISLASLNHSVCGSVIAQVPIDHNQIYSVETAVFVNLCLWKFLLNMTRLSAKLVIIRNQSQLHPDPLISEGQLSTREFIFLPNFYTLNKTHTPVLSAWIEGKTKWIRVNSEQVPIRKLLSNLTRLNKSCWLKMTVLKGRSFSSRWKSIFSINSNLFCGKILLKVVSQTWICWIFVIFIHVFNNIKI